MGARGAFPSPLEEAAYENQDSVELLVALPKKALLASLPPSIPSRSYVAPGNAASIAHSAFARSLAPILAPRIIEIGPIHFVA